METDKPKKVDAHTQLCGRPWAWLGPIWAFWKSLTTVCSTEPLLPTGQTPQSVCVMCV